MKAFVTLVTLVFSITASAAATELVILDGYKGPSNYDVKNVSTVANPLSVAYLVPVDGGAYCFNGDVNGVDDVIQAMINYSEADITIQAIGTGIDTASVGNPVVIKNLILVNKDGDTVVKCIYPQLRHCNRVSKK